MTGISACIIARDEEAFLPDCLASLRGFVEEVCLVDTGSTDRTCEIAESHGARVSRIVWQQDFSLARNVSLELATQPWILVIDADERLDPATGPLLRTAIERTDALAFLVARDDLQAQGAPERLSLPRLFRNDPRIRFNRPVHENIMEALFVLGAPAPRECGARLIHVGYLPEVLRERDKHGRNLTILRKQFAEQPGDLYSAYKLAATLPESAQAERLRAFARAQAQAEALSVEAREELPFLPRLFDAHAAALASSGALTRAFEVAERGLAMFPESGELLYRRGELARCAGDAAQALAFLRSALEPRRISTVRADRPHELAARAWTSLLALDELALTTQDPLPQALLVRCASVRRTLRAGRDDEAAAALGPLLKSDGRSDEVRLLAGEVAWALGDVETARTLWSSIHAEAPPGHKASVWLALVAVARDLPAVDPGPPRDASEAALAQILARLNGAEEQLDGAFRGDALARERKRWWDQLRRAGRVDLADRSELMFANISS